MPLSWSSADLSEALRQALPADRDICIGLSGGMDSVLLLSLAATLPGLRGRLTAIHVNHGLSPHANDWQQGCIATCKSLNVPLTCIETEVRPEGEGPEAAARTARYRVFREHLPQGSVLVTAHHADDQAETMLLRMLRGGALAGLGGIRPVRNLTDSQHDGRLLIRPWLDVPRDALRDIADELNLQWWDDESNTDTRYDRNWLRHDVLPALQSRQPALSRVLSRTALRLQADYDLLTELLQPQLDAMLESVDWPHTGPWALVLDRLQQASENVRVHALRYWLMQNGVSLPEGEKVWHWLDQCLSARADRHPECDLGQRILQRFRGRLYVWAPYEVSQAQALQTHVVWSGGELQCLPEVVAMLTGAEVVAAAEMKGMTLRASPDQPSRNLKDLWQYHGVPVWLRRAWPVVVCEGKPVALCGLMNDYFLNCELVHSSAFGWSSGHGQFTTG